MGTVNILFFSTMLVACVKTKLHLAHTNETGMNLRKRRMSSSGMYGCVALVRTDVPEKRIASIIRAERIRALEAALAVTIN
jgi:hypothetical protein